MGAYFACPDRDIYKDEAKAILKMGLPMCLASLFQYALQPMSIAFCGHLGKLELAAVALSISLIYIFGFAIGGGISQAGDTFFSQAFGSENKKQVGIYLQRNLLITGLTCLPCWALFLNAETVLVAIGQDPAVARISGRYMLIYIPGLLGNYIFFVIRGYVIMQRVVYPVVFMNFLCCAVLALLSYIFIFVCEWGIEGSSLALMLTMIFRPLLYLLYIKISGLHEVTWGGWSLEALQQWGAFMKVALPTMLLVLLWWASSEIGTILAGTLSPLYLDSWSICFQIEGFAFMGFMGYQITASARCGAFLGANDPLRARITCITCSLISGISGIVLAALILGLRGQLPYIFTNDSDVLELAKSQLPILSLFVLLESITATGHGIIKGMGEQKFGSVVVFISFYIVALPIGIPLMFLTELKTSGFWWALIGGQVIQSLCFIIRALCANWTKVAKKAKITAGIEDNDELNKKQPELPEEKQSLLHHEELGNRYNKDQTGESVKISNGYGTYHKQTNESATEQIVYSQQKDYPTQYNGPITETNIDQNAQPNGYHKSQNGYRKQPNGYLKKGGSHILSGRPATRYSFSENDTDIEDRVTAIERQMSSSQKVDRHASVDPSPDIKLINYKRLNVKQLILRRGFVLLINVAILVAGIFVRLNVSINHVPSQEDSNVTQLCYPNGTVFNGTEGVNVTMIPCFFTTGLTPTFPSVLPTLDINDTTASYI
ncbi:unnamed protein product [Owenia fusiformis]|uniref:Multidrug and toxin extrusion protein n=1 Tax=Owenia fusiformis TaxID=6347 RepID=A0A8J1XLQ0_OWEFU|nr:unnamed protein product [Owenia fusiformis]